MTEERIVRYPFFSVDHHADAVYVAINEDGLWDEVDHTEEITPHINADYDKDGNVIGIEFLSVQMDFGKEFGLQKRDD